MFTGIIQAKAAVARLDKQPGLWRFGMAFDAAQRENLQHGASVAHNGVCLTVAATDESLVYFDVMQETLDVTNLSLVAEGEVLNIERAMRYGDEIGGHILSGHVHCRAQLIEKESNEQNSRLRLQVEPKWMNYILAKGFVAVDGASLTVGKVGQDWFEVYLIPETRQLTTLDEKPLNAYYNIEIDAQTQAIVDTVERVLAKRQLA